MSADEISRLKSDVQTAQSVVDLAEQHLEASKDQLRSAEAKLSEAYPMICEVCQRGTDEPHRHWNHKRLGKDMYYTAKMIPRPPVKESMTVQKL